MDSSRLIKRPIRYRVEDYTEERTVFGDKWTHPNYIHLFDISFSPQRNYRWREFPLIYFKKRTARQ
jgi:hypothetical protein